MTGAGCREAGDHPNVMKQRNAHPCRKLKLKETDLKMLDVISANPGCGIELVLERVPELNPVQIRKRLTQLKKHGYIQATSALGKLRLTSD